MPVRCEAIAENGHRCLLTWDHESPHCTIGTGGWYRWPRNPSASSIEALRAKLAQMSGNELRELWRRLESLDDWDSEALRGKEK